MASEPWHALDLACLSIYWYMQTKAMNARTSLSSMAAICIFHVLILLRLIFADSTQFPQTILLKHPTIGKGDYALNFFRPCPADQQLRRYMHTPTYTYTHASLKHKPHVHSKQTMNAD